MMRNIFRFYLLCCAGFLQCTVAAVVNVQISDTFTTNIPNEQAVYVIQDVSHTFECLATTTGSNSVEMEWTLTSSGSGTSYAHDEGYPQESSTTTTTGQVTFIPELSMNGKQLNCRVTEGTSIINRAVVISVRVTPTTSSVILFDSNKPGGYDPSEVATVTQGESHTLNCEIKATRPACEVTWTLDENVVTTSEQHPGEPRLSDTLSKSTFVPLRGHHQQIVVCSATIVLRGDTRSTPVLRQVQLEVKGRPDDPYIVGPRESKENEEFELECKANNAFPPGTILWFLDNNDITNSAQQTNDLNPNGRYNMLSTLTYTMYRQNNQQRIRCEAHHQTRPSPLSTLLDFDVKFCPAQVTLSQCPTIAVAGNTTTLSCRSTSSNPDSNIMWFVNGEARDSDHNPTYENSDYHGRITQQKFTSHKLTVDDFGIQFDCCAKITSENVCSSEVCSQVCQPDLYHGPVFKAIYVPDQQYKEGVLVPVLSCDVIAKPQPDGFVWWSVDGTKIAADDTDFDEEGGRLTYYIQKVNKNHAGLYKCVAENRYGHSSSQELPLTVTYKPILVAKNSPELYSNGDRVVLNATIQANPTASVTWISPAGTVPRRGNERYEIYNEILDSDDVRGTVVSSRLVIKSLSEQHDDGKFVCRGNNNIGQLEIDYDIKVGTPPKAPIALQVVNSTSESLTLQWKPGDNGGLEQHFWLRCGDIDKIKVNTDMTSHTVTGLESNTQYNCTVYGENDVGRGLSSSTADTTNPSPHDVIGIQIVVNRGEGKVSITNMESAGPNVCVQLETRPTSKDDWDKTGPCHSNDTIEDVDKKTQIRATTCATIPPGKCSEPSSIVEDGQPESNLFLISIIAGSVGGVFLLVVLIMLFKMSKRRNCWKVAHPPRPPAKSLRPDSVASVNSFDDDGEEEESVEQQVYVNTTVGQESKPPPLKPKPGQYEISANNVISDAANVRRDKDGYLYPRTTPRSKVESVIYDPVTIELVEHDVQRLGDGDSYYPVTPDVIPTRFPPKPPLKRTQTSTDVVSTRLPLKPPLKGTQSSTDDVPTRFPPKPPLKGTQTSTGQSKSKNPESLQSQLAKALEMRKPHDSDA